MATIIKSKIESYHVQPNGIMKLSSLLKLFQKSACLDLAHFNISDYDMRSNNMAFVLVKYSVHIIKEMNLDEEIVIKTYPRKVRGAAFIRDFIAEINGEICAKASSTWALLDLNERKLLRPDAIDKLGIIETSEENPVIFPQVRRNFNFQSPARTNVRKVRYSQLDMNNHLNNTYYSDFIFDEMHDLDVNSGKNMYIEINYKSEAILGDSLHISFSDVANNEFYVKALKNDTSDICFTAYVNFDYKQEIS